MIESAAGTLGSPGIVMMAPHITTINSAPEDNLTSLIGNEWPVGAPFAFGSVEKPVSYTHLTLPTNACV